MCTYKFSHNAHAMYTHIYTHIYLACSHFVSAKADDMIDSCFLKITAEVVGVKLTAADIQKVTVSTQSVVV